MIGRILISEEQFNRLFAVDPLQVFDCAEWQSKSKRTFDEICDWLSSEEDFGIFTRERFVLDSQSPYVNLAGVKLLGVTDFSSARRALQKISKRKLTPRLIAKLCCEAFGHLEEEVLIEFEQLATDIWKVLAEMKYGNLCIWVAKAND
jgi:hypothetical protein